MRIYFILLLGFAHLSAQGSRLNDSLALVSLYDSTNGDNWTVNDGWKTSSPLEDWIGIGTNGDRVISINLSSRNLVGTLPTELSNLTDLEYFRIPSNSISGPFPSQLLSLTKLYYIGIYSNNFTGPIPTGLNNLKGLIYLYLFRNNFNALPVLDSLKILDRFYVYENDLNFSDLVINKNLALVYRYSPQNLVGADSNWLKFESNQFTISYSNFNHLENKYTWFKNGQEYKITNSAELIFNSLELADAGIYQLHVTNVNLPDLTIKSGEQSLTVAKSGGPSPPIGVVLSPINDNSIKIEWLESTDNQFNNYYIYMGATAENKNKLDSIFLKDQTSYTINNLNPGQTVYVHLTEKNTLAIESNPSIEYNISTLFGGAEVGKQFNLRLTDHKEFSSENYNDVWGFEENGNDYVMISRENGFEIYRLTDLGKAELILVEESVNNDHSLWGEMRYYQGYIYKSTETDSIRIYSLNLNDSSTTYIGRFHGTAHNINMSGNYLFACGGVASGVACYDISTPESPQFKWLYSKNYVHDFSVQNDTMYVAEINNSSFAVYDISNVTGDVLDESYLVLRHEYPNGFTHTAWPTPDGNYVVTTDEHDQFDHLQLWNITDKQNIENIMKYRDGEESIVHNAFIQNDFIFASYYSHGLVIIDISDKKLPVKIAQYDSYTIDDLPSFEGNWGVYPFFSSNFVAMSNRDDGLDIVEFDQNLRAGLLTISFFDSLDIPYNQTVNVSVDNSKDVKFYQENNQVTLKGKPGTIFQLTFDVPNKNFSKTIDYAFPLNSSALLSYSLAEDSDPSPPVLINIVPGNQSLTLTWQANPESDIKTYLLYLSQAPNSSILIDSVNSIIQSKTIENLNNGETYYLRIKAKDNAGNLSAFSNELSATPQENFGSNLDALISVFRNPVFPDNINISFKFNLELSADPIMSINSVPLIVTKLTSKRYLTSYKLGSDGNYQLMIHVESFGATKDTNRTIVVQTLSKQNDTFNSEDQKINLKLSSADLEKPIQLMAEFNNNKSVTFLNDIELISPAKLSIKYDPNMINKEKLFIYQSRNEKLVRIPTQIFQSTNLAVSYVKQLGYYKLEIDKDFNGSNLVPDNFSLSQNYPNPFNPSTTIQYDLPVDSRVQILIYNTLGQIVRNLTNEYQLAGSAKKIIWDGRSESGQLVASGIYFYQLITINSKQTKKMVLLK